MLQFSRWKIIGIALICLAGLIFTLPNFFSKETVDSWPAFFPKKQLNLGLDLRGGAHLLLAMDVNDVRKDWLETLRDDTRKRLRDAKVGFAGLGIQGNTVQVRLAQPGDSEAALKALRGLSQQIGNPLLGSAGADLSVKSENGVITLQPTEAGLQQRISNAASASIETIRRRIDALGTSEATVVHEGRDRILVQYPGLQDTTRLKELIGETAKLSFHEVSQSMSAEEAKATRPPPGFRVYESAERDGSYLLRETPVVRGDQPDHLLPLQPVGRTGLRKLHEPEHRQALCHRARRQGAVRTRHP